MSKPDFSEVGHTGGRVTFKIQCDAKGAVSYSTRWEHSRPTPATLVGVYVHRDGFVCGGIKFGGISQDWNAPPLPNCYPVMMASDSEGRFGHECPQCKSHFRTSGIPAGHPLSCPYCGLRTDSFRFLTPPQNAYIEHYLSRLEQGLQSVKPGKAVDVVIDMDALSDEVPGDPRPDFYVASVSQQTQFKCSKCNSFNDVRGRYAYCAMCGWRNNAENATAVLSDVREQLNLASITPEDAVKKAVSEFDAVGRNFASELARRAAVRESRRKQIKEQLFHAIDAADTLLKQTFDIRLAKGLDADRPFLTMMFARRHIYEHDGGVATARYVRDSGDNSVSEGQLVRETQENANRLIGHLNRMIGNLDEEFHELFPPYDAWIKVEDARKARLSKREAGS